MGKKAAQAIPNQLLRRARRERGWTQRLVAERIGAPNDVTVTRWERGTAFPSPHYVERLCQLFERPASELGLLEEIRAPALSQRPSRNRPAANDFKTSTSRHSVPLLSSLPLIGRETDICTLQTLYQNIQRGEMQVGLIQGEAGIGKTRLASTFLSWAATQGATLLQGRAFEMGGRLPYQPLVHALSSHLEEEQVPEALLSAPWLSELSRILPELRERYPLLPEVPGDEMAAHIRLFEAVTRLVQALCERSPVVLCIDDVQWADAASLDILHYMGQRWSESGMPLLLLLSLRSEDLAMTSSLSRWVLGLRHDLPVTDITLASLTLEETMHLLEAIFPRQARQQERFTNIGQWLFRETQGHPFYLVETLKDLLERQLLTVHPTSQGEELELDMAALDRIQQQSILPPGVRRLILSQWERLTLEGRALLMASAILGQEASFDLLCRVADVQEHNALTALEETLRRGLLREIGEESSRGVRYLFGHDKIREVIVTEMGDARRRLLHRHALAVLETEARPAAELAHHALAAGLTEETVRFSLAAGDEAFHLYAKIDARLHYTRALEALSHLPETTTIQSTRVETILKLIQATWIDIDLEYALQQLTQAEEIAHALHDQRLLVMIHYWIARISYARTIQPQARSHAEQVLREARALGDEELVARASVHLSWILIMQGQFAPIEGLLTPIIPMLERITNWLDRTYALVYLGVACAARGHCAEGVALGKRAVEITSRVGELKAHLMARHFLSIIYLYSNDLPHMLEQNDQVVQKVQQINDWFVAHRAYGFQGWAQWLLGKHEEAMQSIAQVRAAASRGGEHVVGQNIFEAVTAGLLLATGQVEAALAHAAVAIDLARKEGGNILGEGIAERVRGQALARLSRWEEAQVHLAASVQTLLSGEALLEAARTRVVWGLLCRDHGERKAAQTHFEWASAQFKASGLTHDHDNVQRYLLHIRKRSDVSTERINQPVERDGHPIDRKDDISTANTNS